MLILKILNLFLNLDIMCSTLAEVMPIFWYFRSHTLSKQKICLLSILALALHYDTPKIWNDLPDDVHSAKSLISFRKKLKTSSLCKSISTMDSFFSPVFSHGAVPCYVSGYTTVDFCFSVLCA